MAELINARIDGLDEALAQVSQLGKAGERAATRAVSKTTRWATGRIARDVAKQSRVPLKALTKGGSGGRGKRVYQRLPATGELNGQVWVGLNPVKSGYLGNPRKARGGARVGKHFFPGAFKATLKSGYVGVFSRRGQARLPIDDEFADLESTKGVVQAVQAEGRTRLRDVLFQELNYEVNVKR